MLRKRSRLSTLVLGLSILASAAPALWVLADTWEVRTFRPERVFKDLALDRPAKLTPVEEGFTLLDRDNHRILRLDEKGRIMEQIGQIGQAEDELYFPSDYAVGPHRELYVTSGHVPFEVKRFSFDGDFKGRFEQGSTPELAKFATSWSVAVDSRGGVFLSQPRNDALVTVYDSRGRKLRGIGEKLDPEAVYPEFCKTHPRCRDRRYRVTLNRVRTAIDGDDHLYVAFDVAPIVRRYDAEGRLVFETRLEGGHIDEVLELQWESPEKWYDYYSYNIDGVQALTLVNGLTVDSDTGRIYCLIGSQAIYVLAPDGRQVAVLNQDDEEQSRAFDSIAVAGQDGYLTNWGGLFRFKVAHAVSTPEAP